MEFETLVQLIVLVVAIGLIVAVFNMIAARAEEKTSEKLCRGFNAIRYGTKVEKGAFSFNIAPRACKTIDKGDIPGKDYKDYAGGLKEGAKAELRDMIAKCWWMWLEGKQEDMFTTSPLSFQNKCFVCYTFSLNKDVAQIKISEFAASLNNPYIAVDASDRCAGVGQGGFCKEKCDRSIGLPKEVASNRCETFGRSSQAGSVGAGGELQKMPIPSILPVAKESQSLKCCIGEDECVNKGGRCSYADGYVRFDKWACSSGTCYVKKDNFASYLDYVQGTGGTSGGAGFIVYEDKLFNEGFWPRAVYGITFISPGSTPGIDTALLLGATFLSGVATAKGVAITPVFKWEVFQAGAAITYYTFKLAERSGSPAGYNFIYFSEFDKIKDKCVVEFGVGEK